MLKINKTKCAGCGACVQVCPKNAISIKNNKAVIDQNKCNKCNKCKEICPLDAIEQENAI